MICELKLSFVKIFLTCLMKSQDIPIGADHAGVKLKDFLIIKLSAEGDMKLKDFGTFSEASVDYPDFIHPVAKLVDEGENRIWYHYLRKWSGSSDDSK